MLGTFFFNQITKDIYGSPVRLATNARTNTRSVKMFWLIPYKLANLQSNLINTFWVMPGKAISLIGLTLGSFPVGDAIFYGMVIPFTYAAELWARGYLKKYEAKAEQTQSAHDKYLAKRVREQYEKIRETSEFLTKILYHIPVRTAALSVQPWKWPAAAKSASHAIVKGTKTAVTKVKEFFSCEQTVSGTRPSTK